MIESVQGTTQSDPLSVVIYALGTTPLIRKDEKLLGSATQCRFVNGTGAGGSLQNLYSWWKVLAYGGPQFGYYMNPLKMWLAVKEES